MRDAHRPRAGKDRWVLDGGLVSQRVGTGVIRSTMCAFSV
jgi:hypothetical protein